MRISTSRLLSELFSAAAAKVGTVVSPAIKTTVDCYLKSSTTISRVHEAEVMYERQNIQHDSTWATVQDDVVGIAIVLAEQ